MALTDLKIERGQGNCRSDFCSVKVGAAGRIGGLRTPWEIGKSQSPTKKGRAANKDTSKRND